MATSPHIAIIGHISPEEFKAKTSANDLAGGSYNRFILVYVERSQRLPHGGGAPQELIDDLALDLGARLILAESIDRIGWSREAREYWPRLYDEFIEVEDDREISAWAGRAVPYTRRLAALYAALDGRSEVSCADLDSAAAFVRYGLESARFVVGQGGSAGVVEDIGRWIQARGSDGVSRAEITIKYKNRIKAPELSKVLDTLVASSLIEVRRIQGEIGRPSDWFFPTALSG